jgi:hypothetical protein
MFCFPELLQSKGSKEPGKDHIVIYVPYAQTRMEAGISHNGIKRNIEFIYSKKLFLASSLSFDLEATTRCNLPLMKKSLSLCRLECIPA